MECPWCVNGRAVDGMYAGMTCRNCHGRRKIEQGSVHEACQHEYEFLRETARCEHVERCVTCHHEITVDSS